MLWALIASLALALAHGPAPVKSPVPKKPSLVRVAQQDPEGPVADAAAERELYELANQARAHAGLAPLAWDEGLSNAARDHAQTMAAQSQLSHQLPGESALAQRIAANTGLHLDRAGENVAQAGGAERAQYSLMASAPHRRNLLDPSFNVAGFGAVWAGETLYVVQDFGHQVESYSVERAEQLITSAVLGLRDRRMAPLAARMMPGLRDATCRMARQDRLDAQGIQPSPGARFVLAYTNPQPDAVPGSVRRAVEDASVQGVSVGACFERTATYPGGTYWVTLVFY